mmetsp:Transcript_87266/g.167222  ORF Transcript_87266/g.167222 Transcript_87266/m.167222 type:complete len:530 (+) Transcript_87266:95-1684(+)
MVLFGAFTDNAFEHHSETGVLPGYAIECNTTGFDLKFTGKLAKVVCPPHCERKLHEPVLGASLHPLGTSVCGAAVVDGVLSPEAKGELLVTRVPGIPSYTGADGRAPSLPVTNIQGDAFHVYATDTPDQAPVELRLLDHSGASSSRGLLQLLTGSGFGTVCGANFGAADVVCRQLGYEYGTLSTRKCDGFPHSYDCGAEGTPVAMKNLQCKGREGEVQDCEWETPDQECFDHKKDVIMACFDKGPGQDVPEGQLRLVDADRGPVKGGHGRLEMYVGHGSDAHWGPICAESFHAGDVSVACRTMGFIGADVSQEESNPELSKGGEDAVVTDVACSGNERSLLDCPRQMGEDAVCSSKKAAVVKCVGNGPGNLAGLGAAVPPPAPFPASFAPKRKLACTDTLSSIGMDQSPPGTSFVVSCPGGCEGSQVSGHSIYTSDSSICSAAQHAGVMGTNGGDAMVTVGMGQQLYFGVEAHGIHSREALASRKRSFLVATPTPEVLSRVAEKPHMTHFHRYAGSSALAGLTHASEFL